MIVEPLFILIVIPVLVGLAAALAFHDVRRASLAALVGAGALTTLFVQILDLQSGWNWIAAILVSPLPIAISVAAALFCYGRLNKPTHRKHHDA